MRPSAPHPVTAASTVLQLALSTERAALPLQGRRSFLSRILGR